MLVLSTRDQTNTDTAARVEQNDLTSGQEAHVGGVVVRFVWLVTPRPVSQLASRCYWRGGELAHEVANARRRYSGIALRASGSAPPPAQGH